MKGSRVKERDSVRQPCVLKGVYQASYEFTSANWEQICCDHEEEFPQIRECRCGTCNVQLTDPATYSPPGHDHYRDMAKKRGRAEGRYVDGNYVSPRAHVIKINDKPLTAWLYYGGHPNSLLELLCQQKLSDALGLKHGQSVTIVVEAVPEGTPGMPGPPPKLPGRKVS